MHIPRLTAMIVALALAFAMMAGVCAQEQDWSVSLTFATENAEDPLPVVIGVNQNSQGLSELKPPPPPGMKDVGDARYAVVSSWVVDPSARKVVTRKLGRKASDTSTALVWPVTVLAEEAGADVFVTPDLSALPQGMQVFLVDPMGKTRLLLKNATCQKVFESTGEEKELVAVASRDGSFLVSDSQGQVYGYLETSANEAAAGAEIFVDGSATPAATVDEDGSYSMTLSPGTHDIEIQARAALKSSTSITTGGEAAAAEPQELRLGDINGDGIIDIMDFALLKNGFGKSVEDAGEFGTADINGDGLIDIEDFAQIKKYFGTAETEDE